MTWKRIEPFSAAASRTQPVTVSTSGDAGRMRPSMTITVRRDQLHGLDFLERGTFCSVLLGEGAEGGQVRLETGPDFRAKAPTGKKTVADTISVRVPLPPGVKPEKRRPVAVEHDFDANWLILTLPAWGQPPAPPAPRTGIMDRVPDPAASLRGRSGR